MIPLLLAALLQAECIVRDCPDIVALDQRVAAEAGLWIGGLSFEPGDIESVAVGADAETGSTVVLITFTRSGQAKFGKAQRERVDDILEIWVDGALVSSPVLREPIEGAEVAISGSFDWQQAEALAERIRRGG